MESKFNAPIHIVWKKEADACHKDDDNCKDGSITVRIARVKKQITIRNAYPEYPCPSFKVTNKMTLKKIDEFMFQRSISIAKSIANDIIIPNPAPQWVSDALNDMYPKLASILEKDSARCFLRLFVKNAGKGMTWDLTITAQTLTYMVSYDALRCAKVVLEGKAAELCGRHANPNCINSYGFFPLHEAAERFSVEMIKLLLRHGASANVRTVGDAVIADLLPLHVAVENTCLHKYLEDNLFPEQDHLDYIFRLIHLLCLPEMKVFLDTTRLLAENTNNLVDEIWNYMQHGKFVQSAVLLLAAQGQIRRGSSSKRNGSTKKDGFDIISNRIIRLSVAVRWEKSSNGMAQNLLDERRMLIDCMGLLIDVISRAGEALAAYIQAHSEVSHGEVLKHVSSILMEYGFCPSGEVIDTINLRPYDCKMSDEESPCKGLKDLAVTKRVKLHAAEEKGEAVRKNQSRGWDATYARRSFFPYWRSVLRSRDPLKVYPIYAAIDSRPVDPQPFRISWSNLEVYGSNPILTRKIGSLRKISPPNQPNRGFGTAATCAFRLLKMLKKA